MEHTHSYTAELTPRRRHILQLCLEEYIRTGEPIGSSAVATAMGHAVSSATVRAEMAELTAMGLMQQPHTSAGRIPTAPAFRLYIDRLTASDTRRGEALSSAHRRNIDDTLEKHANDPACLPEQAAQLLAEATDCAAVAGISTDEAAQTGLIVQGIQLLPLPGEGNTSRGCLAALVLAVQGGLVRTRVCRLIPTPTRTALNMLEQLLTYEVVGHSLHSLTQARMQNLLSALGEYALTFAPVLSTVYELAQQFREADYRLTGQTNLLHHPGLPPEGARALLDFFSARERVTALLEASSTLPRTDSLRVVFGSEAFGANPRETADSAELAGTSFVLTRYRAGRAPIGGVLGVIGPLRMDYAHTIAITRHVANTLGRLLEELLD